MSAQTSQGVHFEAEATVQARPEIVWDILTDYRAGHPNILPPQAFSDFAVESGGRGDGTVIHFTFHAAGVSRRLRQIATTPEPGRTLIETSDDDSARTVFTLTPEDDGRQTRVRITTDQNASAGIMGVIERMMTPLIAPTMRRLYLDELGRLESLAQRWPGSAPTSSR